MMPKNIGFVSTRFAGTDTILIPCFASISELLSMISLLSLNSSNDPTNYQIKEMLSI